MTLYRSYQPADECTGGPTPGAKALMAYFLGRWGNHGARNLGIYNCRAVRGSTRTTSLHGEGRACDFGINPHGAAYGDEIAELLRANSAELGVQCVIWRRRIWSGAYADAGWRAYSGTNPHLDHIHLELSRTAAQTLTPQAVERVLAPRTRPTPPQEDEMSQQQVDQIISVLRRDLGFARNQILTRLGVNNPPHAPERLTPEQLAGIDPARRVDVGFARDQLVSELAAQRALIEAIARKVGLDPDDPQTSS